MKALIAALALATLIAAPTFAHPANAAPMSPASYLIRSSSGVFFVACSRHESRRKKLNGETAYEICLGEWQDTPPAIFLCVVL